MPEKLAARCAHQVDQPPRRRHDQIDTGTQRLDLWTFAHAAEDRGHAQRNMFRVSANVLLDLHHELARRRDHQRARAAALVPVRPASTAASFIRIGRTNAAVFPVPVCAMPMISWPAVMSGIAAI